MASQPPDTGVRGGPLIIAIWGRSEGGHERARMHICEQRKPPALSSASPGTDCLDLPTIRAVVRP